MFVKSYDHNDRETYLTNLDNVSCISCSDNFIKARYTDDSLAEFVLFRSINKDTVRKVFKEMTQALSNGEIVYDFPVDEVFSDESQSLD